VVCSWKRYSVICSPLSNCLCLKVDLGAMGRAQIFHVMEYCWTRISYSINNTIQFPLFLCSFLIFSLHILLQNYKIKHPHYTHQVRLYSCTNLWPFFIIIINDQPRGGEVGELELKLKISTSWDMIFNRLNYHLRPMTCDLTNCFSNVFLHES